jgi:hypothetical protein
MFVYVDESGDPGLKIEKGSSPYFVVALVVFDDQEEVEAVEQRIQLLRRELQLHPHFEFKFNKSNRDLRLAFLEAVAPYGFFYYGITINKKRLYGDGFKFKESFYKYVTQLVLLNAREHLEDAKIYLDASGDRAFRRQMNTYLRKRINVEKRHIASVGFLNSAHNSLIQLADMVVGAINRSNSDKSDAEEYIKVIRHREAHVQIWPKK